MIVEAKARVEGENLRVQREKRLPPSDALPFPSVLFYIHCLRSNLNHVDVLILRLLVCLMGQTPSAPCPSSVHP